PDDPEQSPAPGAAQADQREWGIAARYQQVDRAMVDLAPNALGPPEQAVIERRSQIQAQQHRAIHTEADNFPRISQLRGRHDQYNTTRRGQHRADQMCDAINRKST